MIDTLDPAHFVQAFGELPLAIEQLAEIAEDIEVIARFKLRRHQLLHRHNAAVGVVTELVDIVTFKLGGGR
ncbi:hypothetical protein D3C75_1302180 [compost metagenome]